MAQIIENGAKQEIKGRLVQSGLAFPLLPRWKLSCAPACFRTLTWEKPETPGNVSLYFLSLVWNVLGCIENWFFFLSRFSNSDILNHGWLVARFSVVNPWILVKWEIGRHRDSQGTRTNTSISNVIGYLVWKRLRLEWEIGEHYYLRCESWGQLLWILKLFLWTQRPHCIFCQKLWLILNFRSAQQGKQLYCIYIVFKIGGAIRHISWQI